MKHVHMICNAHLDPVWLWRWEEGCTEALSTFRTASALADKHPGFVFNHNEALLYRWVESHDPVLFEEIRQKVRDGRWHIMGGWHLQPDCNMPAGESFVRNILAGRSFFTRAFGVRPTTAVNFDSFGHSRGLVQVLVQAGYDSYLLCRPAAAWYPFASQDFTWRGLDGSEILVHRSDENYNSVWGHAAEELTPFLREKADETVTLWLWGVGDHGGGPSRKDLADLSALAAALSWEPDETGAAGGAGEPDDTAAPGDAGKPNDTGEPDDTGGSDGARRTLPLPPHHLIHSTPEAYFAALRAAGRPLPVVATGLNPVAPGCYTSQIRVKQKHRQLENELYLTERMTSAAAMNGLLPYDAAPLKAAELDLLFSEFHDALPGSGSQPVEEDTLRQLEHGLQELSAARLRALLALAAGEAPVEDGTSVVLVYNPHPFEVSGITEIEFGTPKQNWEKDFLYPTAHIDGQPVPTQAEKESGNFAIDWRKKAAVEAALAPFAMTRMDIRFHRVPARPSVAPLPLRTPFVFDNGTLRVVVNPETGLMDSCRIDGTEFLRPGSFRLIVQEDTCNSWGIAPCDLTGRNAFALLSPHEGSAFSGLFEAVVPSVRVIEDGDVRTVVEAVFGYGHSRAVQRYLLPKRGTAFDVETRLYWNEQDRYVKLCIDTTLDGAEYWGQIAFGREKLAGNGEEVVAQKWTALTTGTHAFSVLNAGLYGSNAAHGTIGLTLLRSAGFSAGDCTTKALREHRFAPRMDQGERVHRFRIEAGAAEPLLDALDRKAQVFNEVPVAIPFCPSGRGIRPVPALRFDCPGVQLDCLKRAEDGDGFILRFHECQGRPQTTELHLMGDALIETIRFHPFEIRTFRFRPHTGEFAETTLLEGV